MINENQYIKKFYDKSPMSPEEMANRLISRGLIADKHELIEFLKTYNYFRLAGYLYFYRKDQDKNHPEYHIKPKTEKFLDNTKFADIKNLIKFDTELRLLILRAIEKIEIKLLQGEFISIFANEIGPFGYLDEKNYDKKYSKKINNEKFSKTERLINKVKSTKIIRNEKCVKRYKRIYKNEYLPIWMLAETLSMGSTSKLYAYSKPSIRKKIAKRYDLSESILVSWLHCISATRNKAAHFNQIWNREYRIKAKYPDFSIHPEFLTNYQKTQFGKKTSIENVIVNDKFSIVFLTSKYILNYIEPENQLSNKFLELTEKYPNVDLYPLGFNKDWKEIPLLNL